MNFITDKKNKRHKIMSTIGTELEWFDDIKISHEYSIPIHMHGHHLVVDAQLPLCHHV